MADKIPEDVMQAAEVALVKALCHDHEGHNGSYEAARHASINEIARAIMAERERCAQVIDHGYLRGIASKLDMCAHSKYQWEDCDQCAAKAIRGEVPHIPMKDEA